MTPQHVRNTGLDSDGSRAVAERGEGPLSLQALGIVAGGHEELSGGLVADAVDGQERRGDGVEDGLDVRVELADLVVEDPPAAGDADQRPLRRGLRCRRLAGPPPLSERALLGQRQSPELAADDGARDMAAYSSYVQNAMSSVTSRSIASPESNSATIPAVKT